MIGVEVRHLHAKILDQPAAASALIFCVLAVVLIPLCLLRTSSFTRVVLLGVFAVGALLGVIGVYFHTGLRLEPFMQLLSSEPVKGPQPLVPLSLTGLCTIGALAVRLIPREYRPPTPRGLSARTVDR